MSWGTTSEYGHKNLCRSWALLSSAWSSQRVLGEGSDLDDRGRDGGTPDRDVHLYELAENAGLSHEAVGIIGVETTQFDNALKHAIYNQ